MASVIEVPDRANAQSFDEEVPVSTKINGEDREDSVTITFPKSLGDAVAIFGEKEVFKRFVNAYVVFCQGQKRNEMRAAAGAKEPRQRAKYLDELGL